MAVKWGAILGNTRTGNGMRIGWEITQSPSRVTAATTSVKLTLKLWVWTRGAVNDVNNTFKVWGHFGSSTTSPSIRHTSRTPWSTSNRTLVRTMTRTVKPSYSGTIKSNFAASFTGIEVIPGTAHAKGSANTGKRSLGKPATPRDATATRVNDNKYTIKWTAVSRDTSSKRYANIFVQRSTNGGSYKNIAKLGRTATSYSDTTTTTDSRYRWRVLAQNAAGNSGNVYTDYNYTTPRATGKPTLRKSAGSVTLIWKNPSLYSQGVKVYSSPNGTTWTQRARLVGKNLTTWVDTNPSKQLTYYRVANFVTDPGLNGPAGPTSDGLQVLSKPNKPTGHLPQNGSVLTIEDGVPVEFSWDHNPVDGSVQEIFILRIQEVGGSSFPPIQVFTSQEGYSASSQMFENGKTYSWTVATRGEYFDFSDNSNTYQFKTSEVPLVTIDTSAPKWGTLSKLYALWSYYDEEGTEQSAWEAELLDEDENILEIRKGTTQKRTTFSSPLKNNSIRFLRVRVRDGDGLWSEWDEVRIRTSYLPPATPDITGEFNDSNMTVSLTPNNRDPGDVTTFTWAADPHDSQTFRKLNGNTVTRNMFRNPSFENQNPTLGYMLGSNTDYSVTTDEDKVIRGSQSLELSVKEAGLFGTIRGNVTMAASPVENGIDWFTFGTSTYRLDGKDTVIRYTISCYSEGFQVGTVFNRYVERPAGTPKESLSTVTFQAPEGTTSIGVYVLLHDKRTERQTPDVTPDIVFVTDQWIMTTPQETEDASIAVTTEYFDGDFFQRGAETIVYNWTGAPNASTSTKAINGEIVRENLATNPSFENVVNGSPVRSVIPTSTDKVYPGYPESPYTTDWSDTHGGSVEINSGYANSSVYPWGPGQLLSKLGLVPGKTYTVAATVYIPDTLTGVLHSRYGAIVVSMTVPGERENAYFAESDTPPNEPGEYRMRVSFTVPEDATEGFIRLMKGSPDPTQVVYWDSLLLEEGDTDGSYFDGDNDSEGFVHTAYNNFYRYLGDGKWELLEGNVAPNVSVIDPIPVYGPGTSNYYLIEAVSATPSSALSRIMKVEGNPQGCDEWLYLNAGEGWGVVARVRGNPGVEVERGRSKVLRRFVGRSLPVEFMSNDETYNLAISGSLEGKIRPNREEDFVDVNEAGAPVVYRDFWGRRLYTSISEVKFTQLALKYMDLTFNLVTVETPDLSPLDIDIPIDELPDFIGKPLDIEVDPDDEFDEEDEVPDL